MKKDTNIVKIAVEFPGHSAQLIELNQKQPLATIIQDLCNNWGITQWDNYALEIQMPDERQYYVTEKNRNEIKNGDVFQLTYSASKTALDILSALCSTTTNVDDRKTALSKLPKLSTDKTFAQEFINNKGLSLLISIIEQKKFQDNGLMGLCLHAFVELMDHRIASWDILEAQFIISIAGYVNDHQTAQEWEILQFALVVLESIVLNSSTGKGSQVENEVKFPSLVVKLDYPNPSIQQNALALINALLMKTDYAKRKEYIATVWSKQVRDMITKIIDNRMKSDMAYQLYVLQTIVLGLLEQRTLIKVDPQDQEMSDKIKELRKIAFEMDSIGQDTLFSRGKAASACGKDFKRLGFKNENPLMDFLEIPPGMLALDCMHYFSKHHVDEYTKVVLENSCRADEYECPFGRASIELVKLLCGILRIGESPDEQKNRTYYPMFFTQDQPFEELYCTSIVLLNKTWKEMRATTEDFTKVFSVVREQLTRAMAQQPKNYDEVKKRLHSLTYTEITKLWQMERINREDLESHAKSIVELKEIIMPEIIDLIRQQRLGYLIGGTRFTKHAKCGSRNKEKYWYIRLSVNHKIFHYGDCDEKSIPATEELPEKLQVADVKALIVGKECPHVKENRGRNKINHHLAFSLTFDSTSGREGSLDFTAPDENTFRYWIDGINALLGQKMTSKEADSDLNTLLSMEIKLRLLDAEGIQIPQDPPAIPADPPNYDFALDFK